MEHLPEDIMHIIATKLEPYPKSLSRLCLVDKQTYSRLLGHLYRRVALANPHSIEIFCQSMCTSQYETSKLVRSLQMGVERRPPGLPKTPNVLVPGIQLALSKMELLEELLLYFYSIPVERILDNLVGPFHLKIFSGHCINSTATFSFLQTQPTITDLELYNDSETEDFCELLDKNPNVLQSLRRVKAHPDVLARLVPGRPVNQIALVGDLSLVPLLDLSPLARSTMPITSIYFQEFGRTRAGLRHLVASLKSARITSHVEQLTMMEMSVVSRLRFYFLEFSFSQN